MIKLTKKGYINVKNTDNLFNSQDLFNIANFMLVLLDNRGRVFKVNKKACEILGYKQDEIIGKSWFSNFIPKYQRKEVKKVYFSLMKGEIAKAFYYENKILTKGGKEKIISWHNSILKDKKGKIIGTFSAGYDVTKIRKFQDKLTGNIIELQKINSYNELRTKIWQLAADRNLTFEEIIDKAIKIIGPALKVSRVNYNEIDGKNLICLKGWKEKGIKSIIGKKIDLNIARIFLKPEGFELTLKNSFNFLPKKMKKMANPVVKKFAKVNDLKTLFVIPIYAEGELYSVLSCYICNSNRHKDRFDKLDKMIIIDLRNILQSRIEYDKIQNVIQENEEKFKVMFENAPDAYYLIDFKGNFLGGNKKAEELTGYKREKLIGKSFLKLKLLFGPQQIAKAAKLFAKNIAGESTGPDEFILKRRDGKKIDVEITSSPIKFKSKKLILGIARDITERNKFIYEIRRLSTALEQSPDSIVITDIKGNIVYVNPQFIKITGYSQKELIGQNPRILKSGHTTKKEYENLWKTILAGDIWRGEFLNKKKNGELYWEAASITPIKDKDGKITNFLGIKQDITEIKKSRDKIIETNTLLLDFFENAKDLIQIISPNGRFLYINKAWRETLGYSQDEIKEMTYFDILHPSKIKECKKKFQKVLKEELKEKIETIFVTKDKREIIVEGNVTCHFENGKPVNIRTIFRDISAKKKEEENLRLSYEKLKEIDAMKTNFVSMVSHDLRTPLTAIKGFLSLLLGGAAGELNLQQKEYIEIVRNNSERLLTLINDLLDISKIESGKFVIEKHTSDIVKMADKLINDLNLVLAQKKITIKKEVESRKLVCDIDEYRISQVLTNLITNSAKFSFEGSEIILGIKEIKKEEIVVPDYIKLPESSKYLYIYERDFGVGIAKEHIERIFDRFYQVASPGTTQSKGLGLGLAISKNIIEAHNGVIWAESEGIGKGTKFNILIPL